MKRFTVRNAKIHGTGLQGEKMFESRSRSAGVREQGYLSLSRDYNIMPRDQNLWMAKTFPVPLIPIDSSLILLVK